VSADRRRWAGRVALAALVWLAVCVVAALFGARPHYGLVALAVAAVAGALVLFLDTTARAEAPTWRLPDLDPVRPPGEDPRLGRLHRVVGSHLVSREVDDGLHRQLMAAVDHRLVAHHGVSLRADPERAAGLMGPDLARFAAATDPYPRLTAAQIDVLIDRIEEL
jgi:hypothetical protein